MVGDFQRWWAGLDGTPGEVVWDADPEDLAADLRVIGEAFDPDLPVVDLGCGDGRQTRYLGAHFARVVGTDFAAAAIARARGGDNPSAVSYRVLDAREPAQARQLHGELGDVNVYIRGVLHALPPPDRPAAVRSIEALLGATGTLFLKELSPAAGPYFAALVAGHGPPPGFTRMQKLIPPGTVSRQDIDTLFSADRFQVLSTGDGCVHTVHTVPTGDVIKVPALHAVIRPVPAPLSA